MTTSRATEVAAWQTIRDMVVDHMADRRAEVSERLGMSFIKAKALRALGIRPMTMGELTATLHTDAPYTSLVVATLVDRRLAIRIAQPLDRRRKMVELTRAGRELAQVVDEILDRPPAGFRGLAGAELTQVAEALGRLSDEAGERVSRS